MRFYDVTGGSISVDGKPITEVSRHTLRGSYGMVLQDTWTQTWNCPRQHLYRKTGCFG